MQFDGSLKDFGPVETGDLTGLLAELTEEDWQADAAFFAKITRNRPGDSLVLLSNADFVYRYRWADDFKAGVSYTYKMHSYERLGETTECFVREVILPSFPDTDIARIQYTRLHPGEVIPPHADGGILAEMHRLHLPLKSHPDVKFRIGEDDHYLKEGHLYELNNQIRHSVENNADIDRIHLIVDLLPISTARITRLEKYEDLPPP